MGYVGDAVYRLCEAADLRPLGDAPGADIPRTSRLDSQRPQQCHLNFHFGMIHCSVLLILVLQEVNEVNR